MNFEFSDDQLLLREQSRGFLAEFCPRKVVRAVIDGESNWDRNLWRRVVEMGWTATTIPESYGGLGLTYYELVILAEEMGRSLAPLPFSSSVYLATEALLRFGSEAQKNEWLPKLADGECVGTFALAEGVGRSVLDELSTRRIGDHLEGSKYPVPDAQIADFAVVIVQSNTGLEACLLSLDQAGVTIESLQTLDMSRSHGRLIFDLAEVEVLGGRSILNSEFDRFIESAAVLFAWELLGIAESSLNQAKDYALQRFAFGRQIGSFQAIKHKLAKMYVKNTLARSNAYYGVWALVEDGKELPLAAATARVSAIQAASFAAEENIQTHGGMGFTWEFDCHLYYRRAKLLSLAHGGEGFWQDKLVAALAEPASL